MIKFLVTVRIAHNLFSKAQNHQPVSHKKGIPQLVQHKRYPIYMNTDLRGEKTQTHNEWTKNSKKYCKGTLFNKPHFILPKVDNRWAILLCLFSFSFAIVAHSMHLYNNILLHFPHSGGGGGGSHIESNAMTILFHYNIHLFCGMIAAVYLNWSFNISEHT